MIGSKLDPQAKKILAFSDNRQDASLQAGHFNDFIQILLLRGAPLAAARSAGEPGLTDETLTQRVLEQLRLDPYDYAINPEAKGIKAQTTIKTLRDVLGTGSTSICNVVGGSSTRTLNSWSCSRSAIVG